MAPSDPASSEAQHPPSSFSIETRGEGHRRLLDEIADRQGTGGSVPCVADPEGGWTSDDARDRARAATKCAECSVFKVCGDYADRHEERFGVWAGQALPRRSAQPNTYARINPHVWMDSEPKQPASGQNQQPKEQAMTRATSKIAEPQESAPGTCRCGCGETATRNYRPGHDARHVGQLLAIAKAQFPGIPDHEDAKALYELLPTEPLKSKLYRAIDNAAKVAAS